MKQITKHKTQKPSLIYRLFKTYLRFLHDRLFYSKTYTIQATNIPSQNKALMVVSNHQNCLNDPLGILFAINDRKPYFITRANVFELHPLANKFLRSIGLLPAFRMDYEGEAALGKNADMFKITERELVNGNTIVMFPEAGHQDKRWLGTFSFGYTKLAFEAAEMDQFKTEILILPACNHYSNYFGIQNQFMVKFGTPISLQPYYELYKTKPRTAQREVNKLVRAQIEGLMLDIRDLENYDAIDYLRQTYGKQFAKMQGYSPKELPEMLLSDRQLISILDQEKEKNPTEMKEIYTEALQLKAEMKKLGITDEDIEKKPNAIKIGLSVLAQLFLFPLWICSLWPSLPMYAISMGLFRKCCKDPMFEGTFLYAINALFLLPLFSLITLILVGINIGWWIALIYVLLLFPIFIWGAWKYTKWMGNNYRKIKLLTLRSSKKLQKTQTLRDSLFKKLNKITSVNN
ncbi:MAG: hypothetical protein E7099_01725 [Mediterranea massiliensis]|nr:hypothetical protein [Mediterranea massiliensis]